MHEVTNGIVGQEDTVDFLKDAAGGTAVKMHQAIALIGLEFVIPDFDLPAFETLDALARARRVCDKYIAGTSVTVIAALLILLPLETVIAICAQRFRVCDALLLRRGKYCSECGSRA